MKNLLCGALSCAMLIIASIFFVAPASAMASLKSILTPANVVAACQVATTLEAVVLANEQTVNIAAGKQVVRTGTTSIIANVTATDCTLLGGVVTTLAAAALANAPTLAAPATPAPAN
jgi:hypothetical protein